MITDPKEASFLYLDVQIASVTYVSDYTIRVCFVDGTEGNISLDDLVGKGVFAELKDATLFSKVYSTGHGIAWSDRLEIDSDRIYQELIGGIHATDL